MDVVTAAQRDGRALFECFEACVKGFQLLDRRPADGGGCPALDDPTLLHLSHRLDDAQRVIPGKDALLDEKKHQSLDQLALHLLVGNLARFARSFRIGAGIID